MVVELHFRVCSKTQIPKPSYHLPFWKVYEFCMDAIVLFRRFKFCTLPRRYFLISMYFQIMRNDIFFPVNVFFNLFNLFVNDDFNTWCNYLYSKDKIHNSPCSHTPSSFVFIYSNSSFSSHALIMNKRAFKLCDAISWTNFAHTFGSSRKFCSFYFARTKEKPVYILTLFRCLQNFTGMCAGRKRGTT